MSDQSGEYVCELCTYVQSIDVPKCEMCETPNPHRSKPMKIDSTKSSHVTTKCPKCHSINSGDYVRVCEICEYDFTDSQESSKRSHSDDEDDEDDYNDNADDYFDTSEMIMSQNQEKKRKPIEAVEKPMTDKELTTYYNQYHSILKEQRQQTKISSEKLLHTILADLFHSLQYKSEEPEGQLVFRSCQICFDRSEPVLTMKACGHRMICADDFHQYLVLRIRDGDILPWIPCPAEICNVPCSAADIIEHGRLNHAELLSFLTTFMFKKLSRNENFISCVHCERGGFLQFGPGKKQEVTCSICQMKQTIEKGSDGDLDIAFKQMIQSGELRDCPTCRHLTMKEKGLCNVIECAKCGIWWNWRTREQGHNGKDLKQKARMNGTLWEPGELRYQQELERSNPQEFKALLERNGIQYNPNYVRGGWNDQ